MTARALSFVPPRFAQSAHPKAVYRPGLWMQILYASSFLILQLAAGLLSAWQFPAAYVLGAEGCVLLALTSTALGHRQDKISVYIPVVLAAGAIFTVTILSTAHTFMIALQSVGAQALNALIYFFFVVASISILVWDSRRRFGNLAAKNLIQTFYIASVVYCILQLGLLYWGYVNPIGESLPQINGEAVFAKFLGFRNSRAVLPVSTSLQAGAAIPLATCICAAAKLARDMKSYVNVFLFFLGLYIVFLLDAQQFILSIGLTCALTYLIRSERIYGLIAALAPWMYVTYASIGQKLFPFLINFTSSRGRSAYGIFTGREYIWNRFWDYFQDANLEQLIFGNGTFGQGISRLSSSYAVMFAGFSPDARYLATLHNSYLQIIVDNGLIGLTCFTALIGFTAYRARVLSRQQGPAAGAWRAISMLVTAFAFTGASEVAFTIYMKEALIVTVLVSITVAVCGGDVDPRANGRNLARRMQARSGRHRADLRQPRPTPLR